VGENKIIKRAMNEGLIQKPRRWWRAEFFSPKDLLFRAAVIALAFLIVHMAGLREFTSVLNGTIGSVALGWKESAFLGVIYLILYLAFVLLAPILVIAATISVAGQRLALRNKASQNESGTNPPKTN
jgi:TRAP-type C4-dicarboxylate transport system permease small subunit